VNVATGKANREDRTNEGNRLKKFFCHFPRAPGNDSLFWRWHHRLLAPEQSNIG
jgi:hypothetical protein